MEIPMITIQQYNDIVADQEKCFLIFTKQKCSVCGRLMPNMEKIADEYSDHPEMHFYNMEIHDPDARALFKSWNLVGCHRPASSTTVNSRKRSQAHWTQASIVTKSTNCSAFRRKVLAQS